MLGAACGCQHAKQKTPYFWLSIIKSDNCVSRREVISLVLSSKLLNSIYKLMGKQCNFSPCCKRNNCHSKWCSVPWTCFSFWNFSIMPKICLRGTVVRQPEDLKVWPTFIKKRRCFSYHISWKITFVGQQPLVSSECHLPHCPISAAVHTIWPKKGPSLVSGCQFTLLSAQCKRHANVHWHSLILRGEDDLTHPSYVDFNVKAEKLISSSVLPAIQTLRSLADSSCRD